MRAISFLLLIGIIANSADAAPTQFTEHVPAEHFEVDAVVGEAYAFDSSEVDELPEMIQEFRHTFRPEQMTAARAIHIVKAVSELKKSAKSPMLGKVSKLLATAAAAEANPTHKDKLKATVARKSELVAKLDEIMNQLKSEYADHKEAAQAEAGKITNAKTGIEDNQFGPLVQDAKKWCKARDAQELKKAAIPAKRQAEADAKEAKIPSPKTWESGASNFEVTYQKGAGYTAVTFSAATTFQAQFESARKNYWEAKKAHFEANEEHTKTIEKANLDGAAFKSTINELAAAIATQCADFKRDDARQIIVDFNTQNIKRASVFSILKLVKCHVESIDNQDDACTESDVKSDFADLNVPSTTCPTTAELKEVIRTKKTDLNFHFEGADDSPNIDADGNFVSGRGWSPTQDACAKVDTHHETLFGTAYPYVWTHIDQTCTQACHKYGDQQCDLAGLKQLNADLKTTAGISKFNEAMKQTQFSKAVHVKTDEHYPSVVKGPIDHTQEYLYSHSPGLLHSAPTCIDPQTGGALKCTTGEAPFEPTCEGKEPCKRKHDACTCDCEGCQVPGSSCTKTCNGPAGQWGTNDQCTQGRIPQDPRKNNVPKTENFNQSRLCACKPKA